MGIRMVIDCEICLDEGRTVPAEPVYMKVGDVGGLIDLCPEHTELIFQPLHALIVNHSRPTGDAVVSEGRPVRRAVGSPVPRPIPAPVVKPLVGKAGAWPCPACPERPAPFASQAGLQYHADKAHQIRLASVHALITSCRMPGCEWANANGSPSIGSHLAHVHDIPNIATMTAQLAATDPARVEDIMDVWLHTAGV